MLAKAFEFSDDQLNTIVDALQFQLLNDEELCDECADELAAMSDLFIQLMDGSSKRERDIEDLMGLFG